MLSFHDYKKRYGGNTIIQVPQLELSSGIYWLRGENGSGKTTLIRSISGLIPFDGTISLQSTTIRDNRIAYTRMVNYAEAEPQYPGFLTGEDLIHFYAATKQAAPAQVRELVELLGIGSYAGNKVATYSSGMAKKLSLVLAFMGGPKLILLDEPLITLDTRSVANLEALIQQRSRAGVSFLITSHKELTFSEQPLQRLAIVDKTLTRA